MAFDTAAQALVRGSHLTPVLVVGGDGNAVGPHDPISILADGSTVTANADTSPGAGDQASNGARGIMVFINPGAFGASESTMTVTIQGKDPQSGKYYTILQSASLTANTPVVLRVYPGLTASNNIAVSDLLPATWRVIYAASNWGTGGSALGIAAVLIA